MVPHIYVHRHVEAHSPRIRGDGPIYQSLMTGAQVFSPYSRGWSHTASATARRSWILPVFAGMVPIGNVIIIVSVHSPRIRGDGPASMRGFAAEVVFSPYSRGWSLIERGMLPDECILPVFAGMVPTQQRFTSPSVNSPRIRGDGPTCYASKDGIMEFSPYSRGWSRKSAVVTARASILPVFAGMVPSLVAST